MRDAAAEATRGSAIKLGAETTGRLMALATTLVVARGLGVADFGLLAALSGVAVLVAEIADLGLQPTASRDLVAGIHSLRAMLRAKLGLSAVVAAVAVLLLAASPLLGALVFYFTLAGWSEFLGVALRARGQRGEEAATILCLRASGLVLIALALRAGAGLVGIAWAQAASTLPAVALGGLLARRAYHGRDQGADTPTRALLRESFPLGLNGGLALVSLRLEVLALGALRAAREAGVFAAALRVIEPLILVPSSIAAGAMPSLTREAIAGHGPVRQRTSTTAALLAVPSAAGLALLAPGLMGLLFGGDFVASAAPLRILALALVPLFMNGVLLNALIAAGRASWLPRLTSARVGAAAVLALALIPPLGADGAAAGFVASELVLLAAASRACAVAGFPVPVARPLLLGIGASLPMVMAVALSGRGPLLSVALGVATYGATLAAALWALSRLPARLRSDVRCS
jgi:PST family polysaccharide transporter